MQLMKHYVVALAFALCSSSALAAINLNTATKDDLIALPGIGPAKAQAILDYRSTHGQFKSIEEVKDVKGIGAKRFEKIKGDLKLVGSSSKSVAASGEKAGTPTRAAKGDVTAAVKRESAMGEKR